MKRPKYFEGWVFKGICFDFSEYFPKLLNVRWSFMKLKEHSGESLSQALWRVKESPESFVQKLLPRAKSKLVLMQYDERHFFEPSPYPQYTFYDDSGREIYSGGKSVEVSFFNTSEESARDYEELSSYKYQFARDVFMFEFKHPLSGKDPSDKLYQLTKDMYCCREGDVFMSVPTEYTGKFCRKGEYFKGRELVPYILKSMDKQFDFLEADGKRMAWYEELRSELENPTLVLNDLTLDDVGSVFLTNFYRDNYTQALSVWERADFDYLLGEEE